MSARSRNVGTAEAASTLKSLKTLDTAHGHHRANDWSCSQPQTTTDGLGSSDLLRSCEQLNAGTLITGRNVTPKRMKRLLLWPAEKDALKFCLNYSRLFRH